MTYRVVANRKNLSTTLLFTASNTVTLVGNTTNGSAIAMAGETISGASITQVWVGTSSGNGVYWTVARGSNTVGVFDSTAYIDFAGNGNAITVDKNANLVVTLKNGTDGMLMLELQKELSSFESDYLR